MLIMTTRKKDFRDVRNRPGTHRLAEKLGKDEHLSQEW
jgi:hypothetical protein